jgi:predicted amidohydrolase YtcJ/microsomal dipeptidase-like Zn-dependent dipeptidase
MVAIAWLAAAPCGTAAQQADSALIRRARAIHDRVIALDTHVDISPANFTAERNYTSRLETQVDLPKLEEGGLDAVFFIVYVPQRPDLTAAGFAAALDSATAKFDAVHRLTGQLAPGRIGLARTAADVRRIHSEGRKVALIGVENGYPLGDNLDNIRRFAELGARYLSLAHNGHNQLSDSHTGERDGVWLHQGLSPLGRRAIEELNRWGIMVDISHPSKRSMIQTAEASRAPIIASHSGVRALCNHSRNLDDEQLQAMKRNGGVVQLVALGDSVKCDSAAPGRPRTPATVADFVDRIDYAVRLIGIDHVGISSDFDGGGGVVGWKDASETFNVTLELVRRGYTEDQIAKIWSGNLLRVMEETERIGRELRGETADLLLTGARIWTGDSAAPWAEAVATRGSRIIAVGSTADVMAWRGPATRVVDLAGRFITPGLIDNHTHFGQAGALLLGANLLDVADETALVRRVREARDRLPAGSWIVGGDWGAYEAWAQGSTGQQTARPSAGPSARPSFRPSRAAVDSITPATPVLLAKWDRSAWLANGRALELAGADCTLEGVECENGRPTGRLTAPAAQRVTRAIPPKGMTQRLAEAAVAMTQLRSFGVTTIHDNTSAEQLAVYEALERSGRLTVRVYARPTLDKWSDLAAIGITPGWGSEWIRFGGLKGFVDGIMGNSSARFYQPYLTSGKLGDWRTMMEPAGNMERLLLAADSAGYWPQVHAIGDHAIDTLLTMYERVMQVNGPRARRFRVIHTQVIRGPEVADRMARLGVMAEVQPYHAIDDMRWMEERIGPRSRWAYAFRTLQKAGVRLSFGSDWPGTNAAWYTADPIQGMYAAVTRQTLDGRPEGGWYPEERVDLETSLRAYTVNNAWAAGEEGLKGMVRPGLLADLAVWDRDPFAGPAPTLKDRKVLITMVGGRVVFERAELP